MEKRNLKNWKRYIWAFVISTVVFTIVILISYSISFVEVQRVSGLQNTLAYSIFQDNLEYTLFNGPICSNESFRKISSDLGAQGSIISSLEQKLGKNNPQVLQEKQFYTLVELEHFQFVQTVNQKCNSHINTILFFYSNANDYVSNSDNLGNILSVVYSENPNLVIYSFDLNLNNTLIENLKEKYNVTQPLTVIINEKTKLINPQNINDIEKYLK